MKSKRSKQLQSDLEMLTRVAGIEFPYTKKDVRNSFWISVSFLLPVAAMALGHYFDLVFWLSWVLPMGLLGVGVALYYHRTFTQPSMRFERKTLINAGIVGLAAGFVFGFIEARKADEALPEDPGFREFMGTSLLGMLPAIFLIPGLVLMQLGLSDRRRRSHLPLAVWMIVAAPIVATTELETAWLWVTAIFALASFASTAVLHWQLKEHGERDGSD